MKTAVKMPSLTDTMESGRLVRWLKHPGDEVKRGDVIAEVETDKAVTELEAFEEGYLAGPLAAEHSDIAVGESIGWIMDQPGVGDEDKVAKAPESGGDTASDETGKKASDATEAAQKPEEGKEAVEEKTGKPEKEKGGASRKKVKPKSDMNESLPPAGDQDKAAMQQKAVSQEETQSGVVDAAFAHRSQGARRVATTLNLEAGPPYRIERQAALRRVIAEGMIAAALTPQFRVSIRASLEPLKAVAKERDLSFTILLAKACGLTVAEYPNFNSAWTPQGLARRSRVDVGIAMETENGLTSPVLRDVATRTVAELADEWRNLKNRMKDHQARPEEFRGATFYLSNLGTFPSIYAFDAIVPLGAAAILAVATATEQGALLTLSCDHRVLFGADAARFLQSLEDRLRDPAGWMK